MTDFNKQEIREVAIEELNFLNDPIDPVKESHASSSSYRLIENGNYKGEIIECKKATSSKKGTPYIHLELEIEQSDGSKSKVKHMFFCWLPNHSDQERKNQYHLQQVLSFYGDKKDKRDLGQLIGKTAYVSLYRKASRDLRYPDTMEVARFFKNAEECLKTGEILNDGEWGPIHKEVEIGETVRL